MKIEYRIKPVTRYIVTRYEESENGAAATSIGGEYDNADIAYEVGYAVCKVEHDKLGWPTGDDRLLYPQKFDTNYLLNQLNQAQAPNRVLGYA
ncbi:hypothetical protein [Rhizobium sp. BK251]|uniref:hypothetical protein n=1 Tax=Rhizobium sp. BK251 TaxID=2512125 RepID=UPI00104EA20B|nr:hypothetical protein [Rhizobium sp. BK251]TCL70552.1 hypothetical protein EV286_107427 [Rhizobium sp. BK251]